MKAPGFWNNPPGISSALLSPLALIWTTITRKRLAKPGLDIGIPVICIGNLTAGGTGKTPVVMALMEYFSSKNIHVVSRGYGGSTAPKGPLPPKTPGPRSFYWTTVFKTRHSSKPARS